MTGPELQKLLNDVNDSEISRLRAENAALRAAIQRMEAK